MAMTMLNDDTLTVGFARRFATYKRPNLLLHDPARLVRLLTSKERPMQLILAGKAHPQDLPGQALIKQWNDFIRSEGLASQVIFLRDYDMRLAQELVGGVDLWVNTPRRPWEACGTSGMKVSITRNLLTLQQVSRSTNRRSRAAHPAPERIQNQQPDRACPHGASGT